VIGTVNMMQYIWLLIIAVLCMSAQAPVAAESGPIKSGDSIGHHIAALREYGDGRLLIEWVSNKTKDIDRYEVSMWNVGNGILVVENTWSAGKIAAMSYVIRDAKGKAVVTFKVKEFDPTTGEMVIIVQPHGAEIPKLEN
jgi:hypothetical protein